MQAIFKREFLSYFRTPVGYVAMAIFTFISGFIFYTQFASGYVSISQEIITLRALFIVIVPIITMGMFAEDRRRGTEILYYTSPIEMFSVVAGKFLAAMALYFVMFINVFIHMIVVSACGGAVDAGVVGSVLVFFFLAALFISIGLLASVLTDNQIISAIVAFLFILVVQLLSVIGNYCGTAVSTVMSYMGISSSARNAANQAVSGFIGWFDPFTKTEDFSIGLFSVSALVFCISFAIFFLYLSFRILEKKRWSQK
ncbi:MAG: ABC transporter permease [Clostridiales bacterium]|nr:ABC transporter permease [Clostridiales bacterium]